MTDDDFLDSLKAGWRSQSVEVRDLASRLEARRRRAGLVMAFNLLGLASLAVLMLGFAVMAARREDALFGEEGALRFGWAQRKPVPPWEWLKKAASARMAR